MIWNLFRQGLGFFHSLLYCVPLNGNKTLLWDDSILGRVPLASSTEFIDIRLWLTQRDIAKLANISD